MSDINALSSYDYHLPTNLIATKPIMPKGEAKLLVYYKNSGEINHLKFHNLPEILPDCAVIFNDTKVIKARLLGTKQSGGKSEIMLNQPLGDGKFSAYIKGKVKEKSIIILDNGIKAEILALNNDATRIVRFIKNDKILNTDECLKMTQDIGHIPLPPYIKRDDNINDEEWYQSIFAKHLGAVAAPTASLHFDDEILKKIQATHKTAHITLHVGAGTFKGVDVDDIREHKIHSEFYNIPDETIEILNSDVEILGVGTTVTRTVEHYARNKMKSGKCDLFLNPNNKPIKQKYLLTNFHLPKSTLIMLVAAYVGLDETMRIYKTAIQNKYRFYSYGDAMVIL
ncbi:S-adenosylmethionine:tRNA ribosyltransferase-isomerase [Campylobacter majalis]|uniref:S-adenosylmethionine:tRNA ribosyltransferase-isomerase n=1 Tax=Campylobacter majalis TaxID=2790656 RepID=A0ABM8Q219_9BACT|nr:tRNA preQ1(34) S-adenosylmethionine ribosyltransferase-isomerase QueA [Campylobacter majalis]CAD7286802.1 S-adenosylmethionine:tRNA ribosyltransferase-isomerase [Campylobacter majalis]